MLSPVVITFLLLKVSGANLQEPHLKSRGPAYMDYMRRTSALLPLPPRAGRCRLRRPPGGQGMRGLGFSNALFLPHGTPNTAKQGRSTAPDALESVFGRRQRSVGDPLGVDGAAEKRLPWRRLRVTLAVGPHRTVRQPPRRSRLGQSGVANFGPLAVRYSHRPSPTVWAWVKDMMVPGSRPGNGAERPHRLSGQ